MNCLCTTDCGIGHCGRRGRGVLFGLVTSLVSGIQCIVLPTQALSLTVSSRYFFLSRLRHLFGDILERNLGSRAWFSDFYPTWTRQVSKRSQWAGKTKVSPISNINVGGNLEDNACCIFHWRIALIIDLSYEKGIEISARSHVHFLQKPLFAICRTI